MTPLPSEKSSEFKLIHDLWILRSLISVHPQCAKRWPAIFWQSYTAATLFKRRRAASCFFNMISFSNINKQYGKQLLFVDASFQLNPGGPARRRHAWENQYGRWLV